MKLTALILLLSVQLHAGSHERAQQFFIKHYEAAEQLYFCDSIPIELSLSCWALESGYGSSIAATQCNNLGGIKSYEGGKKHNKHFATLSDFYTAYAAIFRQPCYSNDMQPKTVDEYLRAMEYACCSYHHSKGYSRKIKWIIKNFKLKEMKNRNLEHKNHWATPDYFKKQLNKEFNFDFDPCPYMHDTSKWDGLKIDWGNVNFINPPYSLKEKEAFVNKAIQESKKGKICVMLLPVSTSTKLFHNFILPNKKEIRFIKKRIPFVGINSKGQAVNWHHTTIAPPKGLKHVKSSGMHDSMIVVF